MDDEKKEQEDDEGETMSDIILRAAAMEKDKIAAGTGKGPLPAASCSPPPSLPTPLLDSCTAASVKEAPHHQHKRQKLPSPAELDLQAPRGVTGMAAGRLRAFPHVEGNFAIHLYIPLFPPAAVRTRLATCLRAAAEAIPALRAVDDDEIILLGSSLLSRECHISLSRPGAISYGQIEPILAMLRHRLRGRKSFQADFASWQSFMNDEKTRSFLAIEVTDAGLQEILEIISTVNEAFRLHNLRPFYEIPRPHVSLAWLPGDAREPVQQVSEWLNQLECGSLDITPPKMEVLPPGMSRQGSARLTQSKPTIELRQSWLGPPSLATRSRTPPVIWSAQINQIFCKVGQRAHPLWEAPHKFNKRLV